MDAFCDVLFKAPETETFKVQELHLPLYHALCAMVESECFAP
jgi:D-sedoheptulose 7-phosphate isomerase